MNKLLFISLSDFFEYWSLISQYVSVGSIFLWGILGGLLGFVLALVAEIVWRKKITVRRKYKFLQYFTYLYFVFFPLFAGFCFTQWFGFHAIEKQVVKNIPVLLSQSNILFNEHLKDDLEELIGKDVLKISAGQLIESGMDSVGEIILSTAIVSDSLELYEKGIAATAGVAVKTDLAKSQVKSKVGGTIGEALSLEKSHGEELLNTEISEILDTGIVNLVLQKKVEGIFGGLKLQALLIFLIGIALPIGEIMLAHYLERKRLKDLEASSQNQI